MSHEQAYQLALKFFRAGKAGAPMPPIEYEQHTPALVGAYTDGKKYA